MKKSSESQDLLRALPSVDRLLQHPVLAALSKSIPHATLVRAARSVLEEQRQHIRLGKTAQSEQALAEAIWEQATQAAQPHLTSAVNATGIILSTNLGRAALPESAVQAILTIARGHCTLEVDRETGRRGSRQTGVRHLLMELTGAEDALVVNNNAAAVYLTIHTLAAGREVIISRGQLVEIGGAFRMPDIIRQAGAILIEVGTTNRTRLSDYENAIGPGTALILRCHPSNFKIVGFTEEAPLPDLAALARQHELPLVDDVGSGCLLDTSSLGLPHEPSLTESLQAGSDLVMGSGDKLLGGPQAGLLIGRADLIARLRRSPLMRVLRPGKLTLSALEAVLRLYLDTETALQQIPTWRYLLRDLPTLKRLAQQLQRRLKSSIPPKTGWQFQVIPTHAEIGGGSLPGETLPSFGVLIHLSAMSAEDLARALRQGEPAIFSRLEGSGVLLDMRTIEPHEISLITGCLKTLCDEHASQKV
ncbi:MAG: L-seryl-tRNA(Sec) selenium transferase [Fimbriimonadia bacterium]|nr:L-seryl-tRNA(Sec) selenium transferase [Fimbriimonadia bacterium]